MAEKPRVNDQFEDEPGHKHTTMIWVGDVKAKSQLEATKGGHALIVELTLEYRAASRVSV
jgi:hypothetical protein